MDRANGLQVVLGAGWRDGPRDRRRAGAPGRRVRAVREGSIAATPNRGWSGCSAGVRPCRRGASGRRCLGRVSRGAAAVRGWVGNFERLIASVADAPLPRALVSCSRTTCTCTAPVARP